MGLIVVAEEENTTALTVWQDVLSEFRRAGSLIGAGQYQTARELLRNAARALPEPYAEMAAECQRSIRFALRHGDDLNGYYRLGSLGRICLKLRAYKEAAALCMDARDAYPDDSHGYGRPVAWCLVESGAVVRGLAAYRELAVRSAAPDWQRYYAKQIELVEQRKERPQDAQFAIEYVRGRYLTGYDVNKDWFGALNESFRALPHAESPDVRLGLYRLIIESLGGLSDECGRRSWEEKLLRDFSDNADACADTYVTRAERAHRAGHLGKALRQYRVVCTDYARSKSYGLAQFNAGMILKEQRQYDRAISEFHRLVSSNVNDRDMSPNIMVVSRNYRPRAQWEIGNCLFAKGDYRGALEAYRLTQDKYPLQSWCGNCRGMYEYRYAFYQGLCLDYLGSTSAAVKHYYRAVAGSAGLYSHINAHRRLVDIYQSLRKLDVLRRLLDEMDARFQRQVEQRGGDPELRHRLPTTAMRRIMELRQHARDEKWAPLVALLKPNGTVAGPHEADVRSENWEAVEVARGLAGRPKATTPLLLAALKSADNNRDKWIYFALGQCGTPEALRVLKAAAEKETNIWRCLALVYCVGLAGERGERVMGELEKTAVGHLKTAIQRHRKGQLGEKGKEAVFPPVPRNANVPLSLKEIDDDVAREESLPKNVEVDLSTPASTVETFFRALRTANRSAYGRCHDGADKWDAIFRDVTSRRGHGQLRFRLTRTEHPTDQTARVSVDVVLGRKSEQALMSLAERDGNWVLVSTKTVD